MSLSKTSTWLWLTFLTPVPLSLCCLNWGKKTSVWNEQFTCQWYQYKKRKLPRLVHCEINLAERLSASWKHAKLVSNSQTCSSGYLMKCSNDNLEGVYTSFKRDLKLSTVLNIQLQFAASSLLIFHIRYFHKSMTHKIIN